MADYISGAINFQGLGSGTDFSSIIAQLKKIESIPMQRMELWKADWQARAEAFETVLQSMRDAKSSLSAINSREKFITKTASSSKPEIAGISATGKALDGAHSIEVTQLASNAIWSCGTDFEKKTSSVSTQATEFIYTYKGQTRKLAIAGNTSLESFVNMVNNDPQNKGIRAGIVQSGSVYRLQIQGKDSGEEATLDITPTQGLNFISNPSWQSANTCAGGDAVWGAGSGAGEFKYAIGFGSEKTINIDDTTTVDQLIQAIDAESGAGTAKLENGRLVIAGATSVKGPATQGSIGVSYWTSSKYYGANESLTNKINVWKSDAAEKVMNLTDPIHDNAGSFVIDVNGKKASIMVEANTSLKDMVSKINNAGFGAIASAEAINGNPANGYVLRIDGANSFTGGGGAALTGASTLDSDAMNFSFTIGTEKFAADILPGADTAQDMVNAINESYRAKHAGANDVASLIKNADGKYAIQIAGAKSASGARINGASVNEANGITVTPGSWTSQSSFANENDVAVPASSWRSDPVAGVRSPSHSLANAAGNFEFTIDGTAHSVSVGANASLQDIADAVNAAGLGDIATARAVDPTDLSQGYTLNIKGAAAADGSSLNLTGGTVAASEDFSFTLNGTDYTTISIAAGSSARDAVDAINAAAGGATVASLVTDPRDSSKQVIQLSGASVSQSAGLEGANTISSASASGAGGSLPGGFIFGGWVTQEPQNARFRLDNWPDELESSSNNISGVLEGATITVLDVGKAQLSIATDTESVRENIQKFLDAVNSVRTTIRELSKVDDSTSGYNFSVAQKDDDSTGTADKDIGSVLTGNYGVQLLDSRMKSLASSMPPGFQNIMGNDLLSGDLISSLSQIGIKTVSDQDDPSYGLLVIAPPSTASGMQDMDMQAFENALDAKLEPLLNFFACDDEGSSSSGDFRYASHIKGGTKAGTYNVEYEVSYDPAAPSVPIIDVFIDGKKALQDTAMDGYWFTSSSGSSSGLAVQIDNLNAGKHSGKVSIKQGKIREMEDFFNAETKSYDEYNFTGGALEVLKRNYANIMENIDKKIEREQTRISAWEQRQKLAFARLDTLLSKYNGNQQRLESEIKKLE